MAYTHIDPGREIEVSTRLYSLKNKDRVAELVKLPRTELMEFGAGQCCQGTSHF